MARITDQQTEAVMQRYGVIGHSPALIEAVRKALIVAPIDISVLVNGENGTGKDIIPKIIHDNSNRKRNTFIAVNCGAIPPGIISSELFGHEQGAFTGADKEHAGYFETADKGTIFLDEVAELNADAQARLLRVLENGEFMRVGSSKVRHTDVRVVAATNRDLLQMVQAGKFRQDLFYRIASVRIEVPPLRDRGDDIKMLAMHFSYMFADKHNRPPIMFDDNAFRQLMTFRWSGNVRELQSLVNEMSMFETGTVTADTVKRYLQQRNHSGNLPVAFDSAQHDYTQERELIFKMILQMQKELQELKAAISTGGAMPAAAVTPASNRIHLSSNVGDLQRIQSSIDTGNAINDDSDSTWQPAPDSYEGLTSGRPKVHDFRATAVDVEEEERVKTLEDTEREVITTAIERNHGKRKQTAQELGISERTLYRKIKQYGLEYRNNRKQD